MWRINVNGQKSAIVAVVSSILVVLGDLSGKQGEMLLYLFIARLPTLQVPLLKCKQWGVEALGVTG